MAMRPLTVSISLERKLLQVMKRPDVPIALKLLSLGEEKTLNAQLRNELEFFGRAVGEKDSVARFIFFVISMEAIFSRDKHAPRRTSLGDYVSLLGFKGEAGRRVHADMAKRTLTVSISLERKPRHVVKRRDGRIAFKQLSVGVDKACNAKVTNGYGFVVRSVG
ncbi:hypothetical protein, partial [Francisella tularensis]|uniref:hypothetical protein n=1 Tax=Francisella tularensis TaxID=263 RepID=UPI001C0EED50